VGDDVGWILIDGDRLGAICGCCDGVGVGRGDSVGIVVGKIVGCILVEGASLGAI